MINDSMRPPILISEADKQQLSRLARKAANRMPDMADELLTELERADICQHGEVPPNVVKMYSVVQFTTDKGSEHKMQLVYPEESDIIHDRLSILSPMGTALIGLSEGQVMYWTDRAGQERWLKVLEVDNRPIE
jgi:regulator of nucleoside diphosphate kinase